MSASGTGLFDVAVVGGGATGYASALASALAGLRTVLFAPIVRVPPGRTAALLGGSIELLDELGVWPDLAPRAAALKGIRIVDGSRRLLRAPEATFHASEIGRTEFGFNVPNGELVAALQRRASEVDGLTVIDNSAEVLALDDSHAVLNAGGAELRARLVVAADGARSLAREAAGIGVRRWRYDQAAIVATLHIQHAHDGVSTEFHTESGPFTLVPLPGNRVSLVWVERPGRAEATAELDGETFARRVEDRAMSLHGVMGVESPPAVFPLSAAVADRFAARRTVLVGEAAHLLPPIGAQGLNLGLRDVAALRRILVRYRSDPGDPAALDSYHLGRQADIRSRTLAVDLLNRSLLTDFLPVQAARGLGFALAASTPVLRRALMRRGLGSALRKRPPAAEVKEEASRHPDACQREPNRPKIPAMRVRSAKYQVGQIVRHKFFPFRGVIFDVDPTFTNTEEWYRAIPEEIRPSKDQPFYHLLAENAETEYVAYVSEQNLLPDETGEPVRHPQVRDIFGSFERGLYRSREAPN